MYFKKHLNKPTSALTLAPIMVIAMTLALTIGLAQPDSAMASTHSNSSAPDAAPAWILGDNPLSGDTSGRWVSCTGGSFIKASRWR